MLKSKLCYWTLFVVEYIKREVIFVDACIVISCYIMFCTIGTFLHKHVRFVYFWCKISVFVINNSGIMQTLSAKILPHISFKYGCKLNSGYGQTILKIDI